MVTIGGIEIETPLALGPMAGVTDMAFRTICREQGAGLTCTEMVSAKALCYQDNKSVPLLQMGENETPAAAQIFGSDPVCMEEGAAVKVAEAVIRGARCPVTVKFRLGWDKGSINCVEFAKAMEEAGAAAVAVHGRTKVQMYSGTANWDWIREVKKAVKIPVIANGDVFKGEDAPRILKYTGADMAMIGRGVFGNPWIFAQCKAALEGRPIPELPPLAERCDTAVRQFEMAAKNKGEKIACLEARKQYAWYLKGVPHAGYYKEQIVKITTLEDVYRVTKGIKRDLC